MKKNLLLSVFLLICCSSVYSELNYPRASDYTLSLARMFSREIFELNGLPYMNPLVEAVNSTSNSGFYNQAYVPKKVEKPYFKISVNGMMGFIGDGQKTYAPKIPRSEFDLTEMGKYVDFQILPTPGIKTIKDTAGLLAYAFKVYLNQAIVSGSMTPPTTAPTILGKGQSRIVIPTYVLDSLVQTYPVIPGLNKPLWALLSDSMKSTITNAIKQFPTVYTLPDGADLQRIYAVVPQFEIGSIYGTELMLRIIPPVDWGPTIGKFAFWGIGLKHSISQYFPERWFDLAFQIVYQGTNLKNIVGVTQATLEANGTIWNFNMHASKQFEGILDVYGGLSYDLFNINTNYQFTLPVEVQWQLGLLEAIEIGTDPDGKPIRQILPANPSRGYTGDTQPQNVVLSLQDKRFKVTLGIAKQISDFRFFIEYNYSKMHLLAGGIQIIL